MQDENTRKFYAKACQSEGPAFAEKMAEIDLDGSGELDYDEFLDWWQSQDQLAQEQLMKLQALDFRQI